MDFKNMLHQIGQLYQNLTRKQRIVIAASIVVVVGFFGIFGTISWKWQWC